MPECRKRSLRPGSVALTRRQWLVVLVAVVVGAAGLGLVFSTAALGGALLGLAGLTVGLTVALARTG